MPDPKKNTWLGQHVRLTRLEQIGAENAATLPLYIQVKDETGRMLALGLRLLHGTNIMTPALQELERALNYILVRESDAPKGMDPAESTPPAAGRTEQQSNPPLKIGINIEIEGDRVTALQILGLNDDEYKIGRNS